jgi:hypothetical protein
VAQEISRLAIRALADQLNRPSRAFQVTRIQVELLM